MSKIVTIYCEGKKGSHDYDIIDKIIWDIPNIQISPVGSIRGASAIVQYKEANEIVKSDYYLLFRDRDFDKPIPNKEQLEQDNEKNYIFYSYRNTIENYLFDEQLFYSFIHEKGLSEKYNIKNSKDAKQVMIKAAENIRYYQAVRHTMGKMRTNLTNFGTKLTDKSGNLPKNLTEKYCKEEAFKRIKKSKSYAENWTLEQFEKIYNEFIKLFNDDFMNKLKFLVYFQGKDFATSIKIILPKFPIKDYYKFAKENFNFNNYKDLSELRKIIKIHL